MDKETAERLAVLETELKAVKESQKSWNDLIRDIVKKIALWLMGMAMAGVLFGWHLPENIRKALADWASK